MDLKFDNKDAHAHLSEEVKDLVTKVCVTFLKPIIWRTYRTLSRAATPLRPSETYSAHGSSEAPLDSKIPSKGCCTGCCLKGIDHVFSMLSYSMTINSKPLWYGRWKFLFEVDMIGVQV